ncbi:MAG: TatD family hydrolase [Spirochaetia bacterium]
MQYFDTHAHLGLIVSNPIEQIIIAERAKAAGVSAILTICNNLIDFFEVHKNLSHLSNVYFSAGISPSEVTRLGKDWEHQLSKAANYPKVIAIGETGLDYFRKYGDKKSQIELFIRQVEFSNHIGKPLVVHNRESGQDILEILQTHRPKYGAVLHCYSENLAYANKILKNFDDVMFSFAGNVTFRTAKPLQEVAANLPSERILVESESPFMTPAEHHNKRNTPAYINSTVKFLAQLREEDQEELANTLFKNALKFFKMPEVASS